MSPSRDPLRKLRELIIARRLEAALPKARIFEIYLNVIEWGDGIWGAEAAARTYFGVPASSLSASQAALLAGAIINPRVYSPARPNARLLRRQRIVLSRMGDVTPPTPVPVAVPSDPALTEEEAQQLSEPTELVPEEAPAEVPAEPDPASEPAPIPEPAPPVEAPTPPPS